MEILKKEKMNGKVRIDLTGPEGNAFVLLGYAGRFAKEMGLDAAAIRDEMTSGDYEHLITVFDKHFGGVADLYR